MKRLFILIAVIFALAPVMAHGATSSIPWTYNNTTGLLSTPTIPTSVSISQLGSTGNPCITVGSTGLLATSSSCGGGGGSGTVGNGNTGQVAFYNATGTAIIGTSTLRFQSAATSDLGNNIIGGYFGNDIQNGASQIYYSSVIAGGGASTTVNDYRNRLFCTMNNSTCGLTVIGGGYDNWIDSGWPSGILSGAHNRINIATNDARAFDYPTYVTNGATNHGTIGGGSFNAIYHAIYALIGGGTNNNIGFAQGTYIGAFATSTSDNTTIGGGSQNQYAGPSGTISGGVNNRLRGNFGFIGGGNGNEGLGNSIFIGAGSDNAALSTGSVINGGQSNHISFSASGNCSYCVIGGGLFNAIASTSVASQSVIAGGRLNSIEAGTTQFIGSGQENYGGATYSVTVGGLRNSNESTGGFIGAGTYNRQLAGSWGVIAGGATSTIVSGTASSILGGTNHSITASFASILGGDSNTNNSSLSTILNGRNNTTSGATFSVTAGRDINNDAPNSLAFGIGLDLNATADGSVVFGGSVAASSTVTLPGDLFSIMPNYGLVCTDTLTANANKTCRIGSASYNSSDETTLISSLVTATQNIVRFGGGTGAGQPATSIQFYTNSSSTIATSGILAMNIDSNQLTQLGTTSPLFGARLTVAGTTTATCFSTNGINCLGGTINSGLAGQVAYYAANGTAVSGTSTLFLTNENVGIGTTTPGAKLTVVGTTTINAVTDGGARLILRDASTPSAEDRGGEIYGTYGGNALVMDTLQGDNATHMYLGTANGYLDKIHMFTGGTENFSIIGNGNVGIGDTTPASKLVVRGDTHIYGDTTVENTNTSGHDGAFVYMPDNSFSGNRGGIINGTWGGNGLQLDTYPGDGATHIYYGSDNGYVDYQHFYTQGAERLSIVPSGNVGIGITTPADTFAIQKDQSAYTYQTLTNTDSSGGTAIQIGSTAAHTNSTYGVIAYDNAGGYMTMVTGAGATGGVSMGTNGSNPASIYTNGTSRLYITGGGYVGIGTDTPDTWAAFAVRKSVSIHSKNVSASFSDAANSTFDIRHISGGIVDLSSQNNDLTFSTDPTTDDTSERMRITKTGNVGIGTSTPMSKLVVDGDIELASSTQGIILRSPNGSCFRTTVDNSGVLNSNSITCPN